MDLWRNIKSRTSWNANILTFLIVVAYAAIYPLMSYVNASWFDEYSLVENLQLIVLAISFMVAIGASKDRPLFVTIALIAILMIMRETNMGRAYFCNKYLTPDVACKWENLRYGYLADIIRAIYGLGIVVYAWRQKLHLIVWDYLRHAPIFVIDLSLVVISAVVATVAEKPFHNQILEELAETLFYLAMLNCIWKYVRHR